MTSRLTHSEHTIRQLHEARAKHAALCTKIASTCVICREHLGIRQGHTS